ncbi:hypothetical protein [Photobacterium leiognathi]|uniref:hypothetical protein n=1 Tax=Photobacterium leiognathi TaxID=553611 RepID=UPI002980B666|nr:hypothetical protein [Photobacterium leiognathi]
MRRENIKSTIESLFFDASIRRQDLQDITLKIKEVEMEKRKLEKRKDSLTELRERIKYESSF